MDSQASPARTRRGQRGKGANWGRLCSNCRAGKGKRQTWAEDQRRAHRAGRHGFPHNFVITNTGMQRWIQEGGGGQVDLHQQRCSDEGGPGQAWGKTRRTQKPSTTINYHLRLIKSNNAQIKTLDWKEWTQCCHFFPIVVLLLFDVIVNNSPVIMCPLSIGQSLRLTAAQWSGGVCGLCLKTTCKNRHTIITCWEMPFYHCVSCYCDRTMVATFSWVKLFFVFIHIEMMCILSLFFMGKEEEPVAHMVATDVEYLTRYLIECQIYWEQHYYRS